MSKFFNQNFFFIIPVFICLTAFVTFFYSASIAIMAFIFFVASGFLGLFYFGLLERKITKKLKFGPKVRAWDTVFSINWEKIHTNNRSKWETEFEKEAVKNRKFYFISLLVILFFVVLIAVSTSSLSIFF